MDYDQYKCILRSYMANISQTKKLFLLHLIEKAANSNKELYKILKEFSTIPVQLLPLSHRTGRMPSLIFLRIRSL